MSDTPFVLPQGLVLRQDAAGLVVEYAGSIELHTALGGKVSRLSSAGGDVVLHLPMEVGTIEAAGELRGSGDLKVGDLVAGAVRVTGALHAAAVRVEGDLRCEGDLSADRVQAGAVHCGGLDATELLTEGLVETSGSVRIGRGRAGALRCGGDLSGDELTVVGDMATLGSTEVSALAAASASIGGDMKVARAEIGGALSVSGALRGDHVEAGGELEAGGEVEVRELHASGARIGGALRSTAIVVERLDVGGDAQADTLQAGDVDVKGGLQARQIQSRGLRVGGDLRAPGIRADGAVAVGGALDTGELHVASLTVGRGLTATRVTATDAMRLSGTIAAERLDATTIDVEGGRLEVKVVHGTEAVRIGAVPVRADIVIAPTVTLSPKTSGRISVVESENEVGNSKVKGCLSLEDLEDLFGNAEQFLAERGVQRLGGAPVPKAPPLELEPRPASEPDVLVEVEDPDQSLISSLTPHSEQVVSAQVEVDPDRTMDEALDDISEPATLAAGVEVEVEMDLDASEPSVNHALDHAGNDNGSMPEIELLSNVSELDSVVELSNVSALSPLSDIDAAAVQISPAPTAVPGPEGGEDDLFGWADQMLTEVVAQGAINHPDAEEPTGGAAAQVRILPDPEPELEPEPEPELEPEPEPQLVEDPIHGQMQETVTRIMTCYVHTETPPAVARLKDLVDARDYGRIRSDITDIWNQLLKFHQKRGMRIQPQVTTTFNTINSLVRKL